MEYFCERYGDERAVKCLQLAKVQGRSLWIETHFDSRGRVLFAEAKTVPADVVRRLCDL